MVGPQANHATVLCLKSLLDVKKRRMFWNWGRFEAPRGRRGRMALPPNLPDVQFPMFVNEVPDFGELWCFYDEHFDLRCLFLAPKLLAETWPHDANRLLTKSLKPTAPFFFGIIDLIMYHGKQL